VVEVLVVEVNPYERYRNDSLLVGQMAKVVAVAKVMVPMLFVMKEICTICLGLAECSSYL